MLSGQNGYPKSGDAMDITQLIPDDHYEQRRLFAILEQVGSTDSVTLGEVWSRLAAFLELHAAAEEEIFYPALLRAGLAALARLDPIRIASEALASLIDETGHSGLLAIWAEAGPTIIRWMQGRMAVHTTLAPGATLPLLSSATGRVFLGYLPERQTLTLTKQEDLAVAGNPKLLASATRAAGCATASGDHIPGLYAAAAPILNFAGEAEVVMTLVSAGHAIEGTAIERLRSHAAEASAHLGWVEPVVSTDK